jgi:hypothetical protein
MHTGFISCWKQWFVIVRFWGFTAWPVPVRHSGPERSMQLSGGLSKMFQLWSKDDFDFGQGFASS